MGTQYLLSQGKIVQSHALGTNFLGCYIIFCLKVRERFKNQTWADGLGGIFIRCS